MKPVKILNKLNNLKNYVAVNQIRYFNSNDHPFKRTVNILVDDVRELFGKKRKFVPKPRHADVVIIGGGLLGSAVAYWLKVKAGEGISVLVLEKDVSYKNFKKNVSMGVLSQHYSLPENILLSQDSAEFLRNIKYHLGPYDINFKPCGYLVLACEKYAEKLEENVNLQKEFGVRNDLLSVNDINKRYPWINTDDVKLGCIGSELEGSFNSWALLDGYINKCQELGVNYIHGEVIDFEFERQRDMLMEGVSPGSYERLIKVVYRTADNEQNSVEFAACILAAGEESAKIAKLAKIGSGSGLLSVPLPIERREHKIYNIKKYGKGLGLNVPIVLDSSGMWLQKNGLESNLYCGLLPSIGSEEEREELNNPTYSENLIKASLYNRVKNIELTKVEDFTTECYDCNTYDDTGILGNHPYYNNMFIAAGFGKNGCAHSPGIGRAIAELIIDSQFKTIDLTRYCFDRVLNGAPVVESNIY